MIELKLVSKEELDAALPRPSRDATPRERRYYVWTVGCQMNMSDSERLESALQGVEGHAGHGTPSGVAEDPHGGHVEAAAEPSADHGNATDEPHTGHGNAAAESHAGHASAAAKPQSVHDDTTAAHPGHGGSAADPHAGHSMPSPPEKDPSSTSGHEGH